MILAFELVVVPAASDLPRECHFIEHRTNDVLDMINTLVGLEGRQSVVAEQTPERLSGKMT